VKVEIHFGVGRQSNDDYSAARIAGLPLYSLPWKPTGYSVTGMGVAAVKPGYHGQGIKKLGGRNGRNGRRSWQELLGDGNNFLLRIKGEGAHAQGGHHDETVHELLLRAKGGFEAGAFPPSLPLKSRQSASFEDFTA
jgi:hypothetical protein